MTADDLLPPKPRWPIDQLLAHWTGQDLRVAAAVLSPIRADGTQARFEIPRQELILPDNTRVEQLPLFVEGRLRRYTRRIGVIEVELDAPQLPGPTAEGVVSYRGSQAVILKGPAWVRLAFPLHVERLPTTLENYWEDLRRARAQLTLSFGESPSTQ
jgi:hypothetical protein